MARLMVIGTIAQVEILTDPYDEEVLLAVCRQHKGVIGSDFRERFDTTDDAWQAAQQHADAVR